MKVCIWNLQDAGKFDRRCIAEREKEDGVYLVLCDFCKKNTNREKPVGTVTQKFRHNRVTGKNELASQEFSSEILDTRLGQQDEVRSHICSECFTTGLQNQMQALPEKQP